MEDTCVCCGKYIPEGRMVCYSCEELSYKKLNMMTPNSYQKAALRTKNHKTNLKKRKGGHHVEARTAEE